VGDESADEGEAISMALLVCACAVVASGDGGYGGVAGMGDDKGDAGDRSRSGRDGETSTESGEEGARAARLVNRDCGRGPRGRGESRDGEAENTVGGETRTGDAEGVGEILRTVDEGDCCGDSEGSKGESDGERIEMAGKRTAWVLGQGIEGGDSAGAESKTGDDRRGWTRGEAARMSAGETGGDRGRDDAIRTRANEAVGDSGAGEREDAAFGGERGCREGGDSDDGD